MLIYTINCRLNSSDVSATTILDGQIKTSTKGEELTFVAKAHLEANDQHESKQQISWNLKRASEKLSVK